MAPTTVGGGSGGGRVPTRGSGATTDSIPSPPSRTTSQAHPPASTQVSGVAGMGHSGHVMMAIGAVVMTSSFFL